MKAIIRSRHPSHRVLRRTIKTSVRTIIRLGSTTSTKEILENLKLKDKSANIVEINTPTAIKNSANKLLMKQCFTKADIFTADWFIKYDSIGGRGWLQKNVPLGQGDRSISELPYPIVVKHIFGSRNNGNTLIKNQEELEKWLVGKTLNNYIFEKFYNYNREYRLHVTADGCFYTCRKMLKSDTPEEKRWFRNDSNSVWVLEENEQFDKPVNWDNIIEDCVKALNSVGLDFGAVDLRVQSTTVTNKLGKEVQRKNPEYIVVEINSAPSFGEITALKYLEMLPKLIEKKATSL